MWKEATEVISYRVMASMRREHERISDSMEKSAFARRTPRLGRWSKSLRQVFARLRRTPGKVPKTVGGGLVGPIKLPK
jgi:hypothetical protein